MYPEVKEGLLFLALCLLLVGVVFLVALFFSEVFF